MKVLVSSVFLLPFSLHFDPVLFQIPISLVATRGARAATVLKTFDSQLYITPSESTETPATTIYILYVESKTERKKIFSDGGTKLQGRSTRARNFNINWDNRPLFVLSTFSFNVGTGDSPSQRYPVSLAKIFPPSYPIIGNRCTTCPSTNSLFLSSSLSRVDATNLERSRIKFHTNRRNCIIINDTGDQTLLRTRLWRFIMYYILHIYVTCLLSIE